MRMRRPPENRYARASGVAALLVVMLLAVGGASSAAEQPTSGAAGWESLLGDRPSAQLGGRWIVVLAKPSLATRVRAAGGVATEEQERAWTAAARSAQRNVIARLAFRGAPIEPEHAYYRVFNGFATPLDARSLAIVVRDPDVRGVFPVQGGDSGCGRPEPRRRHLRRRRWAPPRSRHSRVLGCRRHGRACSTRASTSSTRTSAARSCGVSTFSIPVATRVPARTRRRPAGRSATARRWRASSSDRAARPASRASRPGASLLPIRVAGWQPDTTVGSPSTAGRISSLPGSSSPSIRTSDGDAHDAARVALVGVVEPFAAFTDGPLAAAAKGASALDTLVVAAAGNDGPAGPAYGSVGGPGGAPAALTAGAIDTRRRSPTGHVLLLAGLRVLLSGDQPLGGVVAPAISVSARVVALTRKAPAVVGAAGGLTRLFDSSGYSRVGGAAVLLPRGTSSPEAVREVVAAGARAVLVDGPLPAGSLGTDGPVEVPILGLSANDADVVRAALRRGVPVTLAVGAAAFDANAGRGAAAPFSSEGLAFDGGPKPEVAPPASVLRPPIPAATRTALRATARSAARARRRRSRPGRRPLLAQARPDLDAAGLKQALVASSRRLGGAPAGTVDPRAPRRSSSSPTRPPSVLASHSWRTRLSAGP